MLLTNAELYGLVLASSKAEKKKKDTMEFWEANLQPLGLANFPTFINTPMSMFLYLLVTWRTKQQAKNAQSWPRDFLALTPSVKQA
jgi:hypothetical protein